MPQQSPIIVIGSGPAGLMAAEILSTAGQPVTVYERKPSLGRKFLMAGRGGLNLTHSEPFHFLEFRHGPMSMATPGAAIVGFLSDDNYSYQKAVLDEMQDKGSLIIALSEDRSEIALNSHLLESARGVLYLPVLQLMAYYRSLAKGLDPDRPRNLTAVVSFI